MTMFLAIPNKYLLIFLFVVCMLFVGVLSYSNSLTPDSYLHLGVGRFVLQKRHIPDHSDLSFKEAEPSLEWLSHSWLFDTLAFIAISPSEYVGSLLLLVPLSAACFFLLHFLFNLYKVELPFQSLSFVLGTILSLSFWKVHPLSVAVVLLFLAFLIVELFRKGNRSALFFLPIIGVLFANMAGGYILIFSLCLISYSLWQVGICTLLARLNPKIKKLTKMQCSLLILTTLAALAATMISPYGIRNYLYGVTGYALLGTAKWYSTLAGALEVTNTSIFKTNLSPAYFVLFLLYALTLLLLVSYLLIRDRQKFFLPYYSLIPTLLTLWFGFFFVRFIPLSTFLTLPLFGVSLSYFLSARKQSKLFMKKSTPTFISIVLILIVLLWGVRRPNEITFRVANTQCQLIKEYEASPNILVSTELTGYIYYCLFPQKQSIDARDDFFDVNDTIGVYGKLTTATDQNIGRLIEENNINTVLTSKENDFITSYFSAQKDWSLVYIDYNGVLFVRTQQTPKAAEKGGILSYIDLKRNLGFDPQHISQAIVEMENFHKKYPENILAAGQLASLYRFNKQFSSAEQVLLQIPASTWGFALYTEFGRLKAAQGQCADAKNAFEKAFTLRSEQNVTKTVLDMAVLHAICFQDQEKAKHYFERYLSYPLPESERERTTALARSFGIDLTDQ